MEQIHYNILLALKKKECHVRGLVKTLNTNHMTISRKISDLEKMNVVDFRTEGKNNVYFLKKTLEAEEQLKMLEHNKLIQIVQKDPRIRKIIEEIKNKNVKLAILFGSYAKGTETKKSDIDIYINTTNKKLKEELELIDSKLSIKTGSFDKENLLIKEIIKNHIIITGVEKYYELIH